MIMFMSNIELFSLISMFFMAFPFFVLFFIVLSNQTQPGLIQSAAVYSAALLLSVDAVKVL